MLNARRAEREKAAGALRLRAASQERTANLVDTLSAAESTAVNATSAGTEESAEAQMGDAPATADGSVAAPPDPTKLAPEPASTTAASEDPCKAPAASTTTSAPTPSLDHVSDLDFDSMFADTSVPDPSTNIDFDMDFATSDNPFADLTSGNDFTVPNPSNANGDILANVSGNVDGLGTGDIGGDIDSLMPGIESYVNDQTSATTADDIFGALNIPATDSAVGTGALSTTGAGAQPKAVKTQGIDFGAPDANGTTQADVDAMMGGTEAGPMESNFDDLFFEGDMGMGDGAEMGNGEFGDMIDDWFNDAS